MVRKYKEIIVHNGTFHADDVMCVAFMQYLFPDIVVRRLSLNELKDNCSPYTIVADIGYGKYDHHQSNTTLRKDGKKHASCGIIFEEFYEILFDGFVPNKFLAHISQIEDYDNKYPDAEEDYISKFVRLCNPEWNEDQSDLSMNKLFLKTVSTIRIHFLTPYIALKELPENEYLFFANEINRLSKKHEEAEMEAAKYFSVALASRNDDIVLLPIRMPWYSFLIPSKARFVINPSNRGGYHLQCIPIEIGSNIFKQLLPAEWLDITPLGCTFVHQHLFIAAFDTEEHAILAAQNII